MATIVINGVEQPKGDGEGEFPRFEIEGGTLTVKFSADDSVASTQYLRGVGSFNAEGQLVSTIDLYRSPSV